ncbi:MAG: tRNA (adenosine(37)-N6)-dimethylallyltransferase MiaA [Bacteroidota bacterium]
MKLIVILGPTASGKTGLATQLACRIGGEVISADSRQVFRRMTIGTGKDLSDYDIDGVMVPYHLIDILEPGSEFSVFDFQQAFLTAFREISSRKKIPVLCGGTGLYLESVLKPYLFHEVPENINLRADLSGKSDEELISVLQNLKTLHNTTDTVSRERILRAIEIEVFQQQQPGNAAFPDIDAIVFGIKIERKKQIRLIKERLKNRLDAGMIGEVESLLKEGISPARLKNYGLEYKFITQFILGEIDYLNLFIALNRAIHRFSKRQMTWFRRMEKNGIKINWIEGDLPMDEKLKKIIQLMNG